MFDLPILRLIMGAALVEAVRVYKLLSPDIGNPHSVGLGPPIAYIV